MKHILRLSERLTGIFLGALTNGLVAGSHKWVKFKLHRNAGRDGRLILFTEEFGLSLPDLQILIVRVDLKGPVNIIQGVLVRTEDLCIVGHFFKFINALQHI